MIKQIIKLIATISMILGIVIILFTAIWAQTQTEIGKEYELIFQAISVIIGGGLFGLGVWLDEDIK